MWRSKGVATTAAAISERRRKEAGRYRQARQRVAREQGVAVRRQPSRGAKARHVHGQTYRGVLNSDESDVEGGTLEATVDGVAVREGEGIEELRGGLVYEDMDDDSERDSDAGDDAGDEEWLPEDYVSDMDWDG